MEAAPRPVKAAGSDTAPRGNVAPRKGRPDPRAPDLQQHQQGGETPLSAAEFPRRTEGLLQPRRHGPPAAPRSTAAAPPQGPALPALLTCVPGTASRALLREVLSGPAVESGSKEVSL